MKYNWQLPDWSHFKYDITDLHEILSDFKNHVSRIGGILEAFPNSIRDEAIIEMMISEAIKTSEIEGEFLSREDVMSSIKNNLGFSSSQPMPADLRAQGVGELMINVRDTFDQQLTQEILFSWHTHLMKGNKYVNAGAWRTHEESMQIVSNPYEKPKVHFEAPPSHEVPKQMKVFLKWFNATGPKGNLEIKEAPIRSAIAHLYFESIHPFEDGNGRIGRAIAEKALSQGIGQPILLSLSKTIAANKKEYYSALEKGQSSNEITSWIHYFVKLIFSAQEDANKQIDFTLKKVKLFDEFENQLNPRQDKVIKRMLAEGPAGFEGGMSTKKYMNIAKTSRVTAFRDIQDLVDKNIFVLLSGKGPSTRYQLKIVIG